MLVVIIVGNGTNMNKRKKGERDTDKNCGDGCRQGSDRCDALFVCLCCALRCCIARLRGGGLGRLGLLLRLGTTGTIEQHVQRVVAAKHANEQVRHTAEAKK